MCGIVGFIGESTNPKVSFQLLTSLMRKTEHRGKEATGFWATQAGDNGQVLYQKEPIPATEFIQRPMWKYLSTANPSLMIAHCREPTMTGGLGSPKTNKNNHPHVADSMTLALVHNGKVEEYQALKSAAYKGTTVSECDSEMILRIFERGERFINEEKFLAERFPKIVEKDIAHRIYGIEQIFQRLNNGAMAVAIAERQKGGRHSLWLFRDDKRPMHMIDLRTSLGQVWFCSTVQIWRDAVEACPEAKAFLPKDHHILGVPSLRVYLYETDRNQPDTNVPDGNGWQNHWRLRKFIIDRRREVGEEPEEKLPELVRDENAPPPEPEGVEVVTMLNDQDEVQANMRRQLTRVIVEEIEVAKPPVAIVATDIVGDTEDDVDNGRGMGISVAADGNIITTSAKADDDDDEDDKNTEPDTVLEPENHQTVTDADNQPGVVVTRVKKNNSEQPQSYNVEGLSKLVDECKSELDDLSTEVFNLARESSITPANFQEVLDEMEHLQTSIKSIAFIAKKNT